jgi:F-type H+-transporting ATPase subunit alpha
VEHADYFPKVPIHRIRNFEQEYLDFLELKHKDILDALKQGKLDSEIENKLTAIAKEIADRFK